MENPNILDVSAKYVQQIRRILDNKETRDLFLSAVPEEFFDSKAIQILDVQRNPGEWLLYHLGSQEARVSDFISWFESARLDYALMILRVDVPLKIIRQPPCRILTHEGGNLTVTVEASSFPRPEYQWFKEETELLSQQDPELFIPSIKLQDGGLYICRVSKRSAENDTYTWLFSNCVEIIVSGASALPGPESNVPYENNSLVLPLEGISEVVNEQNLNEDNCFIEGQIIITDQPQGYARVPQGFPFYLNCKAVSPSPIKYQWYKNRRIFEGEVSPELRLDYMYPDPQTGNTRFEYFCEVFNDYDKELTTSAIVELEEPNQMTRYFAEDKIALMIANDFYQAYETLKTPSTDVSDLAELLKLMHFKVFVFRNITLIEMENVLTAFCNMIKENSYALFFFAGHGFEHYGQTFIQPVDCSALCLQREVICTEYILKKMQDKKPALNVLLIDACRKSPPEWNEEIKIHEAHMKNNTVYGYSTV